MQHNVSGGLEFALSDHFSVIVSVSAAIP
jgi:hypothetical protein